MDGIDFLNDAPLILRGSRPCQSPKLTFNEPLWVASPAYPYCSSGNNPNLVLYGSGKAGVQPKLIGGMSALVGVGSYTEFDHSVTQSWAERTYWGCDRGDILHPLKTRCVPDSYDQLTMSEDRLTLLTLDLRPVTDPLRSGAIFKHVQRSLPTFPTMPLIAAQFKITAVQFTFIPDWSRFSDRLRSGTDRSPVEWGYKIYRYWSEQSEYC